MARSARARQRDLWLGQALALLHSPRVLSGPGSARAIAARRSPVSSSTLPSRPSRRAGAARPHARRPFARDRLPARRWQARRCGWPGDRARGRRDTASRGRDGRALSHRAGLLTIRSRRGGCARRPPGARARTAAGGGPGGARGVASREAVWSPQVMASAAGSSVTSTTERSSGSPPSRSASGCSVRLRTLIARRSTRRRPRSTGAHGPPRGRSRLFPALLADEGLAAALAALTEETPVEIDLDGLPASAFRPRPSRPPPTFVVAETLRRSPPYAATRRRLRKEQIGRGRGRSRHCR